jgi:hypothetical protein
MTYIYIKKAAKQNGEGLVDGFHDGNFVIVWWNFSARRKK